MNKRILGVSLLAAALCSGQALAVQNVANTSQKGSLLMYPLINVDPENASDTLIEISNDNPRTVHVECEYVNQQKGRVDFDFDLTPKQTYSWSVLSAIGTPVFPSGGTYPGNPNQGELVCFAVNLPTAVSGQSQIAWNHLTGTATVVDVNDTDAAQAKQAFRYNAWAFVARAAGGVGAADGTIEGTAGDLVLTGNAAGTYDGCPQYNIGNFMPNGAALSAVTTLDNDLAAVSCNQDLRQDYVLHLTKLQYTVWNANENSFTGAYQCVDSVTYAGLSAIDNSALVNAKNFDFATLRTSNARFQVSGVASTQCPGSENAGLLGVLTSSVAITADTGEDAELGSTTQGAGITAGFVLWDPAGPIPQLPTR